MSRSAKEFAAYVKGGTEVTFKTASDKYELAGFVLPLDGSGQWRVVAKGWSVASVTKSTRSAARKILAPDYRADWAVREYSYVATMWEVTAPVVRKYFGHHRVVITACFKPGEGWKSVAELTESVALDGAGITTPSTWSASRTHLRRLAAQGYTGIQFRGTGRSSNISERQGLHVAEFTMTELTASMNTRRKIDA